MKPDLELNRIAGELLELCDAQRALKAKRRLMGQPPKRPPGVKETLWLTPAVIAKAKALARDQHCTLSELFEQLLELHARLRLIKAKRRR